MGPTATTCLPASGFFYFFFNFDMILHDLYLTCTVKDTVISKPCPCTQESQEREGTFGHKQPCDSLGHSYPRDSCLQSDPTGLWWAPAGGTAAP